MKKIILSLIILFSISGLCAEEIQFPEEELAKETVLPKFDRVEATKNRNIVTAKKWEVGSYIGWNFTEPIFNQMKIGFNTAYHWSEDSDININFAKWMPGFNSQYTSGIVTASGSANPLDFNRAPSPQYSLFGHYEIKAYYGKISITKLTTMNMSLYPIFGGGVTQYTNKIYPGIDGGIGFKFYFGPKWSLRSDLKLQISQYPSPFLINRMRNSDPVPQASEFADKWGLATIFDFGVSYLF